ncbi:MAG: hypothetical protein AAFO93_07065 [Pseudomonadota bacterium]
MFKRFKLRFAADEDGAVTVDWITMAAVVVILGFLTINTMGGGAKDHAGRIDNCVVGLSDHMAVDPDGDPSARMAAMRDGCNTAAAAG